MGTGPGTPSPSWRQPMASGPTGSTCASRPTRNWRYGWSMTRCRSRAASSTSRANRSSVPQSSAAGSRRRAPMASIPISSSPRGPEARLEPQIRQGFLEQPTPRPAGERHDRRRRPLQADRHRSRPDRRDRVSKRPTIQSATITAMTRPVSGGLQPAGDLDRRRQDGLRRDLRPSRSPRPRAHRRRPRQAYEAASGRRDRLRQGNKRPRDHRRAGTLHALRFPQGQELRADGARRAESPRTSSPASACRTPPVWHRSRPTSSASPGIPMRLKLIDKETGKPVTGADVAYWPIYPNSHTREVPGYAPVRG